MQQPYIDPNPNETFTQAFKRTESAINAEQLRLRNKNNVDNVANAMSAVFLTKPTIPTATASTTSTTTAFIQPALMRSAK